MSWARIVAVLAVATAVEALSMVARQRPIAATSLGSFIYYVLLLSVLPLVTAVGAAVSVVLTGSPYPGIAISAIPLSLSSSFQALLVGLASLVVSLVATLATYFLLELRDRQPGSGPIARARSPSAVPLASASLGLAIQSFSASITGSLIYSEAVYLAASVTAAVISSLASRGLLKELAYGLLSSLGPLGLAVVLSTVLIQERGLDRMSQGVQAPKKP
ncbi:hypothetical protein ASAC_0286 [Acidilobus saccharovorans 345-15]|uniref:Uncharacterized protein n=1 Tax=Acidilobus saccharovorans (strain DSM 16705 / JCM 18335 / VKM B-2471 / 345-15) TaxID=666510 RepID=D9Q055_ACIS3|nr:hypothetical protein [Acidilobus saccharovorans]ADL18693.1 hypothetical protein ASAC_0286 [Acidilobus saccharovorans 345-15]